MTLDLLPPRFINWRFDGTTKVPCRSDGRKIDPHDPSCWMTHAEAKRAPYNVGWVLNGDGWFFLDMDKCATDGRWSDAAQSMFLSFGGALGEVSVSGTGLHVLGRCDPSRLTDRRKKWDGWLECYTDKRFVALSEGGLSVIGGGQYTNVDWTDQLLRIVPQREFLGELPDGRDEAWSGPEDDDELIAIARRSRSMASRFGSGPSFDDFWTNNVPALALKYARSDGTVDYSSVDMAMMNQLAFWTGKDMPRMDRLFRRSALVRDKYLTREDYRTETIQNAARACDEVYSKKPPAPTPIHQATPDEYLHIEDMLDYFAGCTYVADRHKIRTPDGFMRGPQEFNALYGGKWFQMKADNTRPTRKAFEAFTETACHRFPMANAAVFRPDRAFGEIVNGEVNTFVPYVPETIAGDAGPFLDFLAKLVPDDNDRLIVLCWMASLVQNQGIKFFWSIVIQGAEGNGKSTLGHILTYILGAHRVHRPRASQLGQQFNAYLEQKILCAPDEIHMDNKRHVLDDLKPFITELVVPIRRMQQAEVNVRCPVNWIFTTNYKDAVIKTQNDRRYAVIFSGQQTAADVARDYPGDYLHDMWQWLKADGMAIVAHYLLTYRIDPRYDPAGTCVRAPVTSSTNEAVSLTRGGIEAEIAEAIESEERGFRGGWVSSAALDHLVRDRGFRISRPRLGEILVSMGYRKIGRSPQAIMSEGGKRPVLWASPDVTDDTFDAYLSAQGPGYL